MGNNHDKDQRPPLDDVRIGVESVFRGLGDLLRIASNLAEHAEPADAAQVNVAPGRRTGIPENMMHAVYGVSVRIGPSGVPSVAHFGNVRRNARDEPVVDEEREPMADVLDEEDHFVVVVELPGVEAASVHWDLRAGRELRIAAASRGRRYRRTIQLASPVDGRTGTSCYENGVLELKLWKHR